MLRLALWQLNLVSVIAMVAFEDCGSAYDLQEVNIGDCGPRAPCPVTLGENVPVYLRFVAGFQSSKLDQEVVININHVNLRTDVTPELCNTEVCPVRTDGLTTFNSTMTVPTKMALNQRGFLRWRIINEKGVLVLCYSVVVQTQSSLQKMLRSKDLQPSD